MRGDTLIRAGTLNGSGLRSHNERLVLACLRDHAPISRSQIAELVGLTRPAITRIVADLAERGLVVDALAEGAQPGLGRPRQPLELDRTHLAGIGIDLRVDRLEVRGVTLGGATLAKTAVDVPRRPGVVEIVSVVAALVDDLRERFARETVGVGLAVPGQLSADRRTILESAHLHWRSVPLVEVLEERLAAPILMRHVAECAALANARHPDFRDAHRLLQFQVGVGAGAALTKGRDLDPSLPSGWGAVGHLPLGDPAKQCPCGRSGCLDMSIGYGAFHAASARADDAELAGHTQLSVAATVADRARQGDARAQAAIDRIRKDLVRALTVAGLMEAPDVIVLGGYPLGLGEHFLEQVGTDLAEQLHSPSPLRASPLGDEAPGVGAALLALEVDG